MHAISLLPHAPCLQHFGIANAHHCSERCFHHVFTVDVQLDLIAYVGFGSGQIASKQTVFGFVVA